MGFNHFLGKGEADLPIEHEGISRSLVDGMFRVHGYTHRHHAYVLDYLLKLDINKVGGVAEIGIEHGQFYMLLNSVVDGKFPSFAIDIFESQHLNIDGSGRGSLEIFSNNLQTVDVHYGKNTNVVIGDSTDSRTHAHMRKVIAPGSLRYFSIDGGHTAEHTLNDLKLATEFISNEGVVIVDDILHPCWMGVLEGTLKFLSEKPTLVPFALGDNKLYLCKLSFYKKYYEHMAKFVLTNPHSHGFFGHQIATFNI